VLGDLFIHGIGGAKYDRLTDAIIERFFGIEPPDFMVVSGTLHLPIARHAVSGDDLRGVEQELRELTFHPELFLDPADGNGTADDSSPAKWIEQKRRWIKEPIAPSQARERSRAIRSANEHLQSGIAARRDAAHARAAALARELRADAILSSREYGYCLYPEKILRNFLLAFPAD
jgi:hypothetical protein